MKEEEGSEEEASTAAAAKEQDPVPAELDAVHTPEPLEFPKQEDQEGSSPDISLPYKWVVEAANLLIPAVGTSFSEALDLIESVSWSPHNGHRAPPVRSVALTDLHPFSPFVILLLYQPSVDYTAPGKPGTQTSRCAVLALRELPG